MKTIELARLLIAEGAWENPEILFDIEDWNYKGKFEEFYESPDGYVHIAIQKDKREKQEDTPKERELMERVLELEERLSKQEKDLTIEKDDMQEIARLKSQGFTEGVLDREDGARIIWNKDNINIFNNND